MKRKTYKADVTREGKFWIINIVDLNRAVTQGRRLSEVDVMARDLIAIITDTEPDSFDVDIRINLPETSLVDVATELKTQADDVRHAADTATKAAALALVAADIPVRDIASMLNVSPGWVSVLTKEAA